ncbi:MAG: B12-binding domain-containing radical SAM protein, partial [Desulfovibrionaceae bacterium]|nr:B12-binding domain-containing radical SAM protein [Desulfovibrionaceae bacterium]
MRILFIYPRMQLQLANGNISPTAVLNLASFAKREGNDVCIFERNIDKKSISETMEEFKPDAVVCTLVFAQQITDMQAVCQELRFSYPNCPILCGGLMATLIPELILREGLADYIGIGEGEYTLLELLEVISGRREASTVQSLVYLDQNDQVVRTPLRPFADLSDFPETDFSLLPMEKYFSLLPGGLSRTLTVYSSKGCPSQCTFCFNIFYHRCQYRSRKRETVMREIESLVRDYDADGIMFIDEIWGLDKAELCAYCDNIAALSDKVGKQMRWGCEARIGILSPEELRRMAESGCSLIVFGLESGSPEMLNRIKKGYPLNKIESDFNICKEVGISTWASTIFGFPDETPSQIKQTVHTIFRLNPTIYGTGLFYASPGSVEYNKLVSAGRLKPPSDLVSWSELGERLFMATNYSAIPDREL